jgi:hypothetical protein
LTVKSRLAALCCWLFLFVPQAPAASAAPSAVSPAEIDEVRAQLDDFVASYIRMNNLEVRPSRDDPDVTTRDGQTVVRYIEFVPDSSEILPSRSGAFSYLARMTYIEHTYEAVGATREDALSGFHSRVLSRRFTEFPHYSRGQWSN